MKCASPETFSGVLFKSQIFEAQREVEAEPDTGSASFYDVSFPEKGYKAQCGNENN
jgi:hypothetical protein